MFRLLFRGVALVLLLVVAFVAYHLYDAGHLPFLRRAIEDTAVTGSVKAAFAVHRALSARPIEVTTTDARVTLSGEVASEQERAEAEELASNVEGVGEVDNRIEVDPEVRESATASEPRSLGERVDDAALLAKIRTALHLDKETRELDVDVEVSSGRVTLRGEVPSEALAGRIHTRVESVDGVELLENELAVVR